MKICKMCNIEKSLDEFHIETKGRLGRKSRCRVCCTELSKKWKSENSDKEKQNRRRWNKANAEKHKESTYRWRKENALIHNKYTAEWQKKRKAQDPKFKILSNVRSLVSNHFSNKSICKTNKLEDLLKMSWSEFYSRTIDLLQSGMTEENYGKYWSFDHICPCSLARDEEEMILLQHWSNWRPMVHLENLSKQDKITDDAVRLCRILLKRDP